MFQVVKKVNGTVLWCNLHLFFGSRSFPPLPIDGGENHDAPIPVALYGVALLMSGVVYSILSRVLIKLHVPEATLARVIGNDQKGIASLLIYVVAIPLAFASTVASLVLFVMVAMIWFLPDRRIEKRVEKLTEK